MASAGPLYFYEDEVYRVLRSGDVEFGMVTENWEMYSSDDESDTDKVPQGSVAVTWHPKGKEEVIPEAKVKLSDRSLMPGDVVRRLIAGKDTQRGYCRSVKVTAAVQVVGSKKVIPNVLATDLYLVQKLQADVAVYLDSWIGVIRDMHYRLSLRFPDGSACRIDSLGILDHFEDTRRNQDGFGSSEVFYPGQKLTGAMRYLKDADWSHCSDDLKRAKDRKTVTVTVTDVTPTSMNVQWQWQTPEVNSPDNNHSNNKSAWQKEPPPDTIEEKDLKRVKCLNLFESCTVQLGDISFYTLSAKDVVQERSEWKKQMTSQGVVSRSAPASKSEDKLSQNKEQAESVLDTADSMNTTNVEGNNNNNNNQVSAKESLTATVRKTFPKVCTRTLRKKKLKKTRPQSNQNLALEGPLVVETIHTQSSVDVVWQDGTIEEGMQSVDLYPIHHLDDHEFFPGDFVVRADSVDFRTYGVIQSMDHSGRVALVKWFEAYTSTGEQVPKVLSQEEMSVYDIKDHPDYRFRPGTIVIRVANMTNDQYAAGQILDNYPDGQVRVWWANGVTSSCWPQDLFRLGDYDSDDGEIWDDNGGASDNEEDDDVSSDSSWETEAEEELNDGDSAQRYQTIGKLIEQIQKTLVCIRETIVASTPVVVPVEGEAPKPNLSLIVDRRGITKKLLLIYKDCQYLDKIMGSKYFDEAFLKEWFKQMQKAAKSGKYISEQVSKLFELPEPKKDTAENKDVPDVSVKESSEVGAADGTKKEVAAVEETGDKNGDVMESKSEDDKSQTFFVTELCSVILTKLVCAHTEYERRFGSFESKTPKIEDAQDSGKSREESSRGSSSTLVNTIKDLTQELAANFGDDIVTSEIKKFLGKRGWKIESVSSKEKSASSSSPPKAESSASSEAVATAEESTADLTVLFDAVQTPKMSVELGIPCDKSNTSDDVEVQSQFSIVETLPDTHRYRLTTFMPQNPKTFVKTIQKEVALLRESLPEGIFVRGFEDRMDLFSVMIVGPENTPYEDGIFLFDIQLPPAYPSTPPSVHYVSFCPDRLNPNLYECGKVCVSLLGTWSGKGTEVWTSSSSLLQLLISIQGLILVPEPYYNEAGYEKQRGSQQGEENTRMYNEMVLIKLVQSMSRMYVNRHAPWEREIGQYIQQHHKRLIDRYHKWLDISEEYVKTGTLPEKGRPGFSLLPVSKGFSITLKKTLENYGKLCDSNNVTSPSPLTTSSSTNNTSSTTTSSAQSSAQLPSVINNNTPAQL